MDIYPWQNDRRSGIWYADLPGGGRLRCRPIYHKSRVDKRIGWAVHDQRDKYVTHERTLRRAKVKAEEHHRKQLEEAK